MAELRPYEPTWRDRIAQMMMGNAKASPERRRVVEGLLGSSGLGNTGMGVVDVTPVGGLLQAQEAMREGDPRGAALAVLPIPGAAKAKSAAKTAADAATPQGIRAYHGSPYDFERFDLSKIGTGEGNQVYGHGLYFAENKKVADEYKNIMRMADPTDGGFFYARGALAASKFNDKKAVDYLLNKRKEAEGASQFLVDGGKQTLSQIDDAISRIKAGEFKPGKMYEVNIRANPEDFLDWDKPVAQQSQAVREALAKAGINKEDILGGDAWFRAQRTKGYAIKQDPAGQWGPGGSTLEESLAMVGGDKSRVRPLTGVTPEDRSAALRDAGIPGIKYLDQRSRTAGEGSRNYVVFDENLIDILRKYGLVPGMIGGGAAAGSFGLLGPQGQSEY